MELWSPRDVKGLGVKSWSIAWLAFIELGKEYKTGLNTCNRMFTRLESRGWFEGIGLFGSRETRIQERIKQSPYYFWVAYESAGDIIIGDSCPVPPDTLVTRVASSGAYAEALPFSPIQISKAVVGFNLDQGRESLNFVPSNTSEIQIAQKRLQAAAELGSAEAQLLVARMYLNGIGVLPDPAVSFRFASMASIDSKTSSEAKSLRDQAARDLTSAELAQISSGLRSWRAKSWDEMLTINPSLDALD
jgi:hypothetical protein